MRKSKSLENLDRYCSEKDCTKKNSLHQIEKSFDHKFLFQ